MPIKEPKKIDTYTPKDNEELCSVEYKEMVLALEHEVFKGKK